MLHWFRYMTLIQHKKHIPAVPLASSCLSSYLSCPTSLKNAHSLNPLLGGLGLGGRKDLEWSEGCLERKKSVNSNLQVNLLRLICCQLFGTKLQHSVLASHQFPQPGGFTLLYLAPLPVSEQGIVCVISTCFWFCSNCQETLVVLLWNDWGVFAHTNYLF